MTCWRARVCAFALDRRHKGVPFGGAADCKSRWASSTHSPGPTQQLVGKPQVAYAAAKAAQAQFTRTTAVIYARHGVRLNCVVPGQLHTRSLTPSSAGAISTSTESPGLRPKMYRLPPRRAFVASDAAAVDKSPSASNTKVQTVGAVGGVRRAQLVREYETSAITLSKAC
jgi:NAD(P)-dependent dehydrogenase (short-subunit alcohol dehydrogenase family)